MKKHVLITMLASGTLAMVAASCSIKQVEQVTRTITVNGTGAVQVANDQATIRLAVETRHADLLTASGNNATRMTEVQQALRDTGIPAANISTANYSVYQAAAYQEGRVIVPAQYVVTNQINIELKDISKVGTTIDTALKAGANSLSSISYSASIRALEDAVRQARIQAIRQAGENASLMASASGAQAGEVISIQELLPGGSAPAARPTAMGESMAKLSGAVTPVSASDSVVSVTVSATYELQ